LHFIGGGRGRGFGIDKRDLAVSKKAESTHRQHLSLRGA
jgi:hypothetical protein